MPKISLVVCLYNERFMLERLLQKAVGVYDDLLVIHDGPAGSGPTSSSECTEERIAELGTIASVVQKAGGRYIEAPRAFQQETHWPFAWSQAKYDWILRFDADEFPSGEMLEWLQNFRMQTSDPPGVSGYTCNWPLWDGRHAVTERWPGGRIFLFDRRQVRFFGIPEQGPVPDTHFEELPFSLEHRPVRKSYGFSNVVLRPQAYRWRRSIAVSLLGSPLDLPGWRWNVDEWPEVWEDIRRHPIRTGMFRLVFWTLLGLKSQWREERRLIPSAALNGGLNHFLLCFTYMWVRFSRTLIQRKRRH